MAKKEKKKGGVDRKALLAGAKEESKRFQSGTGGDHIRVPKSIEGVHRVEEGTETLAFLPFTVGKNRAFMSNRDPGTIYFRVRYAIHRNVGPEDKWSVCLSRSTGKPCPVCVTEFPSFYSTNIYGDGIFPIADYYNAIDLLICPPTYNHFWEARFFNKDVTIIWCIISSSISKIIPGIIDLLYHKCI